MEMPRFGARAMRPGGMAKGGKVHPDEAMDRKLIRKEIARAEKMEKKPEAKGMKKGGDIMAIKNTPMGRKMASSAVGAKKMAGGGGVSRARGDDAGRAAEDMEFSRAMKDADDADRDYYRNVSGRTARDRMQAQLRNWEANERASQAGFASGEYEDDSETKGAARRLSETQALRRLIEQNPDDKKPAPMKSGGAVKKMARGGGIESRGKTKGRFV
jgi:hypothetical protein